MYIYPLKSDEIYHYGTKEHSGRYPWGSGDRPKQRLESGKSKYVNHDAFYKALDSSNRKEISDLDKKLDEAYNKLSEDAKHYYDKSLKWISEIPLDMDQLDEEGIENDPFFLSEDDFNDLKKISDIYLRFVRRAQLSRR